jgi:hypothetical protein
MSVRAKFKVSNVEGVGDESRNVYLQPVYSDTEENKAFWNATPGGSIQLSITNPAAYQQFKVGQDYYVDFTPADQKQQQPLSEG